MPPIKLSTTIWHSSLLPRDGIQINPVFNVQTPVPDYDNLVNDWMVALRGWGANIGTALMRCKAYDVSKPKPNYPVYEKDTGGPSFGVANYNRELALCLSFYAGSNIKRRRGRLYLPAIWGVVTGSAAERPPQTAIDKAASLVPILTALGGVDVDWSVWSTADGQARAVTNWWVDNEWDSQRRRGLRGTTRTEGTTTEDTTLERQIG
jgi:hypothetical protein